MSRGEVVKEWIQERKDTYSGEILDFLARQYSNGEVEYLRAYVTDEDLERVPYVQTPIPPVDPQGDPPSGSVVGLPPKDNSKIYPDVRTGINDLYRREAQGDLEAKKILRRLWSKLSDTFKRNPNIQFSMTQCPECEGEGRSTVLLANQDCPICGYDASEKLEAEIRELW